MKVQAGDIEVGRSRARVRDWFARTAPLVEWAEMDSPLGALYLARSEVGLCRLAFDVEQDDFRGRLPARARTRRNPDALREACEQLGAYFTGSALSLSLAVDLSGLTPFQQRVLRLAGAIPAGSLRSYGQLARDMGSPRASRAVGPGAGTQPGADRRALSPRGRQRRPSDRLQWRAGHRKQALAAAPGRRARGGRVR